MTKRWLLVGLACALALGCSEEASVVGGPADGGTDAAFDVGADLGFDAPGLDAVDVPAVDVPFRCADNASCAGRAEGAVCDTASGRCGQCVATADTCPAGSYCVAGSNVCATGCRNDEGCAAGVTGDAGAAPGRRCDFSTRACVECVTDEHCPAGTLCVGNLCVVGCTGTRACPAGQTCCSGACVDPLANTAHCGACDQRCMPPRATAACMNGVCAVATCTAPYDNCDGTAANGCETDTLNSLDNCGGCGMACAARPHTVASCAAGRCAYACAAGFADCDGDAANGCEVELATSVAHCGRCGGACALANATAACTAGACAVASCAAGFGDCDGNAANGCETDTRTSATHCGACGMACPTRANAVPACTAAVCASVCVAGFGECDGDAADGCETNLATSTAHCGGCGRSCLTSNVATAACAASACTIATCGAGFADCDGMAVNGCEVDTRTTVNHCGSCGTTCAAPNGTPACVAGACAVGACAPGFADCDGVAVNGCEVDLRSTAAHCGMCGRACVLANATAACAASACMVAACAPGFGDCNGTAADGCELDTTTALANCGACGHACPSAQSCVAGTCTLPRSCAEIHARAPGAATGVFEIDPDGAGGTASMTVYCDMTSSGGGWTLVLMAGNDVNGTLGFNSALWTTTAVLNADVTDVARNVSMKNQAFNTLDFAAVRMCVNTLSACLEEVLAAPSARALFAGAERLGARSIADFATWGYPGNLGCNRRGFNVVDIGGGPARCRYGILLNNEATCEGSVDGGNGLGCHGYYGAEVSAGRGDGIVGTSHERGWMFVR